MKMVANVPEIIQPIAMALTPQQAQCALLCGKMDMYKLAMLSLKKPIDRKYIISLTRFN